MQLDAAKLWIDTQLGAIDPNHTEVVAQRNLILQHLAGLTAGDIITDPQQALAEPTWQSIQALVSRRVAERIPLQYLLGEAWFYGRPFKVQHQAVLIPRPETEVLVELAANWCKAHTAQSLVDLGTGSGCIAVTLKRLLPDVAVTAVDISEAALAVARENAQAQQVAVRFVQGSWYAPLNSERFDCIVSNPPYVARSDAGTLAPELAHEPDGALFAPKDPIALYAMLLEQARAHLSESGVVMLELGQGQGTAVENRARQYGFFTRLVPDYAGIDRVLVAGRMEIGSITLC